MTDSTSGTIAPSPVPRPSWHATSSPAPLRPSPQQKGFPLKRILRHTILSILGVLMILPFIWMVLASFKDRSEVESLNPFPQMRWHTENYAVVLGTRTDPNSGKPLPIAFRIWYFNSIFIAGWVTLLQCVTSALAAYAFSRLHWRGRDRMFLMYLGTMMVPGVVMMIPNLNLMVKMGLYNSYLGLILPGAFSTFGTFLLRQFMLGIPTSLDEAAEMDGASRARIFWDIILPLARPGLITLAIFTFMGSFGSFFWPLVLIKSEHLKTLPVGMLFFNGLYDRQTNLMMAATVMNIVPLIILFVTCQKFLVKGIQLGAVKG